MGALLHPAILNESQTLISYSRGHYVSLLSDLDVLTVSSQSHKQNIPRSTKDRKDHHHRLRQHPGTARAHHTNTRTLTQ